MADSIFTKIIRGEIEAHKIYEDELTLAFLDLHPVKPGHTLVVPKMGDEFIWDLDDKTYQALMATVKKVGNRLKDQMDSKYVGVQVVGEGVAYPHVHVIPFNTYQEFLHRPDMTIPTAEKDLAEMAKKLAF